MPFGLSYGVVNKIMLSATYEVRQVSLKNKFYTFHLKNGVRKLLIDQHLFY